MEPVWTSKEVMKYLSISENTLLRLECELQIYQISDWAIVRDNINQASKLS